MAIQLTLDKAIKKHSPDKKPHVLLGNGFSRACRDDIFSYKSLFERADFEKCSAEAKAAFGALNTTDFEIVMRAMRSAAALLEVYDGTPTPRSKAMRSDASSLREVLVEAIAGNHPPFPAEISNASYERCRHFLARFDRIYSLNYDLLMYWAFMQDELQPAIECDDGFRAPEDRHAPYVTWDVEKTDRQRIFYLHGGLHIFDAGDELQKYTWTRTGIRLLEQIREALAKDYYPLFVAEGDSRSKMRRIRHSDYLSRAYRSFTSIGGTLVVVGFSFGASDDHILSAIVHSKVTNLLVGIHGDPEGPGNRSLKRRAVALQTMRTRKPALDVEFFDSTSASIW